MSFRVKEAFLATALVSAAMYGRAQLAGVRMDTSGLWRRTTIGGVMPNVAVPQNYYSSHLGFFCTQELKMQKAKVPVTFRLGSMDYCNRMEGKPGSR